MFEHPVIAVNGESPDEITFSFIEGAMLRNTDVLDNVTTEEGLAAAVQDIQSETGKVDLVFLGGEQVTVAVDKPKGFAPANPALAA